MHLPRQVLILLGKWVSGGPSRQTDSPARPLATRRLPPARPPARCLPLARPPACLTRKPKGSKGTQKETQGHSNEHRNTYVPRHSPGTYLEWGLKVACSGLSEVPPDVRDMQSRATWRSECLLRCQKPAEKHNFIICSSQIMDS